MMEMQPQGPATAGRLSTAVAAATFAPNEQGAGDKGKWDKDSKLARMCALASQQVSR